MFFLRLINLVTRNSMCAPKKRKRAILDLLRTIFFVQGITSCLITYNTSKFSLKSKKSGIKFLSVLIFAFEFLLFLNYVSSHRDLQHISNCIRQHIKLNCDNERQFFGISSGILRAVQNPCSSACLNTINVVLLAASMVFLYLTKFLN